MMMNNAIPKRFAFTLLELMVAVVVLLAVMIAVGRIFSTVITVSAKGVAIGETLQQATAIEQQLREDLSKVSSDGFMAIRHVAVRNNMYGDYMLIDASQPEDSILRFDQLVFLRLGAMSPMGVFAGGADFAGQSLVSMVHYGHGVSFSQLSVDANSTANTAFSDDPALLIADHDFDQVITPWFQGAVEFQQRAYTASQYTNLLTTGTEGTTNATQQQAGRWMLCRQAVALCDDDQYDRDQPQKKRYGQNGISTHTVFAKDPHIQGGGDPNNDPDVFPHIMHGRVDIAATNLGDIRNSVIHLTEDGEGTGGRPWFMPNASGLDQQELIASLLQWPRVEAYPTAPLRQEQMLMMSGLAQGCVSFQVEWMYDEGVGEATDEYGDTYQGYAFSDMEPQPWWGGSYWVDEDNDGVNDYIGFNRLGQFHALANGDDTDGIVAPRSVNAYFIERDFVVGEGPADALIPVLDEEGVQEYWTIFGYNGANPFAANGDWLNEGLWYFDRRFTPRPSALRVTLRLIDRDGKLGAGWVYQFIVDLPEVNG